MATINGYTFEDLDRYTDTELAAWTLAGYTGAGTKRKTFLGSRYANVQKIVNEILRTKKIPAVEKRDIEALEKAVKELYNEAADELIKAIKEE